MGRARGGKGEKRERKGRQRVIGTLVPLWMVGRRYGDLLLPNPVVTHGRIRFSLFF
jgi:hypothetical protein